MKQQQESNPGEQSHHPQHNSRGKSVGKTAARGPQPQPKESEPPESKQVTAAKKEKAPQPAGAIIGSYRVTKTLGQGTFGKVKEGLHVYTKQKVAIKILEKNKITDVNDVERVTREIHILKIVSHPNIIQLYEIIETPSRLFLIMEHCCNGELFSYITSKNKLKEEESCRLFQQLIAALEYLGRLGIVHRDVKPENLLLDEQLNLKVVDFGLSNTFRQGEKLATACGSPCYAAPELIKGLEYMGPKADLWSAGVVLYTLVCGHLPFEDNNTQSLYQKILSADYKFTCYLSREVRNLIENILVPDPELRYGLKQITSNSWFKNAHPVAIDITSLGRQVGIDQAKIYKNVIVEMEECLTAHVESGYVRKCLHANRYNAVTAHYYLLIKKKLIEGEPLVIESPPKQKTGEDNETTQQTRVQYHMDPSQRALIAAGRQTKKYQSIEPQRTTLYNEKNKYQLRKIAEGLHEFSNIKRIVVPENSVAASTTNQSVKAEQPYGGTEAVQSPVGNGSGSQLQAVVQPGGSGSTANPGQKFLFSPTLTDEAAEEEDDDYLLSQQKGQNNPQQMIFSPTGARTNNHFRQFPISPKTQATHQIEKSDRAPVKQQVSLKKQATIQSHNTTESGATSNKRPFDSSSAVTMTIDGQENLNGLLTSDDQGNQIYEIFEGLGTSSSALFQPQCTQTVGDMLNKPDTGFELFGKGHRSSSIGPTPTKLSGMDSSCPGTLPPQAHMSVMDFLSDKILPAPSQQQRNCSSYQLERTSGVVGARASGLGGSGGVTPGGQAYKRKNAYGSSGPNSGGSHQKTKKKSTNRGDHYTRKASSNLDFLQKGSTVQNANQTNSGTTNNSLPYARPGGQTGQNTKLFDQQIRQILNQSQIVESANNNGMLLIESGATSVGASDLRKITSQLSKNMPNYSRISAMSNYNTNNSVRGSKQAKPKVRGSHSNQNTNATVQHGLLGGLSTGIKLQGTAQQRKTLRSTRENLEQPKQIPQNKGKIQAACIPTQNSLRKGSVSVISPSSKGGNAGSSGTTQNTRLISSGSHIQGGSLIKTSSTVTHQMNQTIQPLSNSTASKGKGSKKIINNQNQMHQQKLDALKNLDKEISLTFQQMGGQPVKTQPSEQTTNTAVLTSLISPNNQAAAHFLTQHHSGAATTQAATTQHGAFLPTSPLGVIQSPGLNPRLGATSAFGNNENVNNGGVAIKPPKASQQTSIQHTRAGSTVGPPNVKQQRKAKPGQPSQTAKGNASLNAYLVSNHQQQVQPPQQQLVTSKHRNAVARANSTVTYAPMTSQQRQQQLSDFIVPSQFQEIGGTQKQTSAKAQQMMNTPQVTMVPNTTLAANNTTTKAQNSRNMHARAMTSLGTQSGAAQQQFVRGPPSIVSPTTLPNDLIELKPKQNLINGNPSNKKQQPTAHKRGQTTLLNQTQPIGNQNIVMFPHQNNNYTAQQASVKPALAKVVTVQAQKQQRPPSARHIKGKAPGNQTVNVTGISQLMSPTAATVLNQPANAKR